MVYIQTKTCLKNEREKVFCEFRGKTINKSLPNFYVNLVKIFVWFGWVGLGFMAYQPFSAI